eukprot:2875094-Pleurochrysis_carterae.AAC.2
MRLRLHLRLLPSSQAARASSQVPTSTPSSSSLRRETSCHRNAKRPGRFRTPHAAHLEATSLHLGTTARLLSNSGNRAQAITDVTAKICPELHDPDGVHGPEGVNPEVSISCDLDARLTNASVRQAVWQRASHAGVHDAFVARFS